MIHERWAKPELPRHEQFLTNGIPDASGPSPRQSQQHRGDAAVSSETAVIIVMLLMPTGWWWSVILVELLCSVVVVVLCLIEAYDSRCAAEAFEILEVGGREEVFCDEGQYSV